MRYTAKLRSDRSISVTMQNFMTICETVAETWQFFNFSKWLPSSFCYGRVFAFPNFKILTARRVKEVKLRQLIKFRGDRSNRW